MKEEEFDDSDIQEAISVLDDVLNLDDIPAEGDDKPLDATSQSIVDFLADKLISVASGVIEEAERSGNGKAIDDYVGNYYLCDAMKKRIRGIAGRDTPLSQADVEALMIMMGAGDSGLDLEKADEWDDGMIGKYAECLRNYLYTYKPEATSIDPSIDPNEEHVGPMAQDIEKVAPDCVKETKDGTKVVDGNRLALVNAGVIGDLSREVIELRSRLAALEARE